MFDFISSTLKSHGSSLDILTHLLHARHTLSPAITQKSLNYPLSLLNLRARRDCAFSYSLCNRRELEHGGEEILLQGWGHLAPHERQQWKRGKGKKRFLPPTWKTGATLPGGSGPELAPDGPLRQGTWGHVKVALHISSCPLLQLWGTGGVCRHETSTGDLGQFQGGSKGDHQPGELPWNVLLCSSHQEHLPAQAPS